MISDEPDQVGKVGDGRLVDDEAKHGLLLDTVDVEREGSDGDPDHALAVVEELDGLGIEREIVGVLEQN